MSLYWNYFECDLYVMKLIFHYLHLTTQYNFIIITLYNPIYKIPQVMLKQYEQSWWCNTNFPKYWQLKCHSSCLIVKSLIVFNLHDICRLCELGSLLLTWFNWVWGKVCNHTYHYMWNVITHQAGVWCCFSLSVEYYDRQILLRYF